MTFRHWPVGRRWPLAGLVLYFLLTVLVGWFHTLHGDEGLWLYQIGLLSKGLLPGLDFVSQEPFALFAPYALALRLLSPSVEAARLVQAIVMTCGNGAIAWFMWRRRGHVAGMATFLLLALNVSYAADAVVFTSQAIAYIAVTVSFVVVMTPQRADWPHYLGAGLLMGFAVAARHPLGLASLALAAHAVWGGGNGRRITLRGLTNVTVVASAAVLMCLPDLLIVLKNPQQLQFVRLGAAGEMSRLYELREGWGDGPPFQVEVVSRLHTLIDYFTLSTYHDIGQNLLLPLCFAVWAAGAVAGRWRGVFVLPPVSSEVRWAALFALPIVLAYLAAPWSFQVPGYLVATYPLSVVMMVSLVGDMLAALRSGSSPSAYKWAKAAVVFLVVIHSGQGLAHGAWQVLFRNAESLGQPMTVAKMACWVEKSLAPDEQLLVLHPIVALLARRDIPPGLEPGGQLKYWYRFTPEKVASLPLASPQSLRSIVAEGKVPLVIDDSQFAGLHQRLDVLADFYDLLAQRYERLGDVGGTMFPETIYVRTDWLASRTEPLPPLPADEDTKMRLALLRAGKVQEFTDAVLHDLSHSVATLPRDIERAWARLRDADYGARCG